MPTPPPSQKGAQGVAQFSDSTKADRSKRQERLRELESYYYNAQYEGAKYDWDGEKFGEGQGSGFSAIVAREVVPANYESLKAPSKFRKPNTIYALPLVVTNRFTSMLFGEEHFPAPVCTESQPNEDFCNAIVQDATFASAMVAARTIGGSTGTVPIVVEIKQGKFKLEPFKPYNVEATDWVDEKECIPRVVTIQYKYKREVVDPDAPDKLTTKEFWFRRVIDDVSDTTFLPVEVKDEEAGKATWEPDPQLTVEHGLGECPVVWIQNLPSSDDSEDGRCDYEPGLTLCNQLNRELSGIYQGSVLSSDPVPVLQTEDESVGPVKKSAAQWITPGVNGKAYYMEITAAGLRFSLDFTHDIRKWFLESCECVIVDPDKFTASAQSGVAIKQLYQPMLSQLGWYRTMYGEKGLIRILKLCIRMARSVAQKAISDAQPQSEEPVEGQEPAEQAAPVSVDTTGVIKLPPRKLQDVNGGADQLQAHDPMQLDPDAEITLNWPPPFPPTYEDLKAAGDAITALKATGIFSEETLIKKFASILGIKDPMLELAKARSEATLLASSVAANMMPGGGGLPGQKKPGGGAPPPVPSKFPQSTPGTTRASTVDSP